MYSPHDYSHRDSLVKSLCESIRLDYRKCKFPSLKAMCVIHFFTCHSIILFYLILCYVLFMLSSIRRYLIEVCCMHVCMRVDSVSVLIM